MKLPDLNLNGFLYKATTNTSPYGGLGDEKLNNTIEQAANRPATAVAPGTVITSTIFQSSGSNKRIEILPNDTLIAYRNGTPILIIDRDGLATALPIETAGIKNNGFDQPTLIGAGFVNSSGTPSGTIFPAGWTSTKLSNGRYQITHNLNTLDYLVLTTPLAATTREFSIESQGLNSFITRFYNNATSALTDTDHYFMVFTNP